MTHTANPPIAPRGEPVWEIAEMFPEQGAWTEQQYLGLKTNRLVEFDDGMIEVLAVPTKAHQSVVLFICRMLVAHLGEMARVLPAPYRLRLRSGKFREPDVLYLTPGQDAGAGPEFTDAAELVMEVVSPDDPDRDYVTKRREYAEAGVPEYWIVDLGEPQVLVLRLENGQYVEHGRFGRGQRAVSHRLAGFAVAVDDLLAQGR